jgi:hypothetical protein
VVLLALEKRLFLNVRRKRLLVSPFGKKILRYQRTAYFVLNRVGSRGALSPEVLEPIRRKFGVTHRVLDVLVAEPSL